MYLKEVSALYDADPIKNTMDAGRLLQRQFADADREYFVSVNLDAQGRPISYHIAGIGSVTTVHFPVASVFKVALLQNAVSVLICHNHPGGNRTPSNEDCNATKELVAAGKLIGIRVLDHIILTPVDYLSLRAERGDLFE